MQGGKGKRAGPAARVADEMEAAEAAPVGRRFGRTIGGPSWGREAARFRERSVDLIRTRWIAFPKRISMEIDKQPPFAR